MPNTFTGLTIASTALRNFQRALDTTGHNISNVNTPGYSRQRVNFSESTATTFYSGGGQLTLGTGSSITSLERIRDQFLDVRMRGTTSDQGRLGTLNNSLGQVQSVFTDVNGKGINDALSSFFTSWTNLAANPGQAASRLQVQAAGQTLTNQIRGTYGQLQTLQQQQTDAVHGTITDIQMLANKIADLNQQVRLSSSEGGSPNDLLDQRDQALLDLSKLTNVSANVFQDGTMVVNVSGFNLVDAQGANQFPTSSYDAASMTVSDGTHSYTIKGGQLAGLMQSQTSTSNYMAKLDNLANTLKTQINALHEGGINPLGNTGVQFFNDVTPPATQTGAADFDLSAAVKADPNAIVTSVDGTSGDGGIALALSQLQDAKLAGLGNNTFGGFYTNLVAQVGSEVNVSATALDTQNSVAQQIDSQIQAVSGVSLDDEMSNMLQFQRSYQAAAKVLSIFDQVTQDVINMIK